MQCVRSTGEWASGGDQNHIVLGPLGEPRAAVPGPGACGERLVFGRESISEHFLARCVRAAGLPERDAEGGPLRYALRWRGPRVVQLLPEVTAASTPRLRRLMADYQLVQNEFTGHPRIEVQAAGGYPPERYVVTYNVAGVEGVDAGGMPIIGNRHVADIYLHSGYPREKPKCVLRTPIFHPNFGSYICIADHWAPGETLVDVIVHIGQMIQYQVYNPASPLNGIAAQWGGEGPAKAEDTIPLAPPEEDKPAKDGFTKLWFD
jgi:ubiquitin-protein ligase